MLIVFMGGCFQYYEGDDEECVAPSRNHREVDPLAP